ncbi:MAG: TIGR00730 family Rossman fold protein [Anaerolineales bacterium]|jgi:uncharacterized protein (TIGR00730 family)
MQLERVCVYCGSSDQSNSTYFEAAAQMGRTLASRAITLVYGGGGTGMMGKLADAILENDGQVIGIIPQMFETPALLHSGLTELRVVATMHERKAQMAEIADAFIALPGGFGTFEELFEILTWSQIGLHHKPIGILNVNRYFNPLLALIDHARAEGFIYSEHKQLLLSEADPDILLDRLENYSLPTGLERWVHRKERG